MTTQEHVKYKVIDDTQTACASGIDDKEFTGGINILDKIKINDIDYSVVSICEYAFFEAKITSVSLPDSIIRVENNAFDRCTSLKGTLEIPSKVEFLNMYAFSNTRYEYIRLPLSIKYITPTAFCCSFALKKFIIDFNNQYYSVDMYGSLYNKNKTYLIQYALSHTFFKIAPTTICFTSKSCTGLSAKKIYVPKGVVYFEEKAFESIKGDLYILADWFIPSKSCFSSISGKMFVYSKVEITEIALVNSQTEIYVSEDYPGTQFSGFNVIKLSHLPNPKLNLCTKILNCASRNQNNMFIYILLIY